MARRCEVSINFAARLSKMGGDENALWFTANESPECASLDDMEVRINARLRLTGPPCGAWRIVPASTMSKIRWHSRKPSNSEKGNEQEFGKITAAAAAAASKTHKTTKRQTAAAKFQEQHRAFWAEERASVEQGFCDGSPCNVTKGTANGQHLRSSKAFALAFRNKKPDLWPFRFDKSHLRPCSSVQGLSPARRGW